MSFVFIQGDLNLNECQELFLDPLALSMSIVQHCNGSKIQVYTDIELYIPEIQISNDSGTGLSKRAKNYLCIYILLTYVDA